MLYVVLLLCCCCCLILLTFTLLLQNQSILVRRAESRLLFYSVEMMKTTTTMMTDQRPRRRRLSMDITVPQPKPTNNIDNRQPTMKLCVHYLKFITKQQASFAHWAKTDETLDWSKRRRRKKWLTLGLAYVCDLSTWARHGITHSINVAEQQAAAQ